jgi:hypothetical protein
VHDRQVQVALLRWAAASAPPRPERLAAQRRIHRGPDRPPRHEVGSHRHGRLHGGWGGEAWGAVGGASGASADGSGECWTGTRSSGCGARRPMFRQPTRDSGCIRRRGGRAGQPAGRVRPRGPSRLTQGTLCRAGGRCRDGAEHGGRLPMAGGELPSCLEEVRNPRAMGGSRCYFGGLLHHRQQHNAPRFMTRTRQRRL